MGRKEERGPGALLLAFPQGTGIERDEFWGVHASEGSELWQGMSPHPLPSADSASQTSCRCPVRATGWD